MSVILTFSELVELIDGAQRAGQAQSAEQIASVIHDEVQHRRRVLERERKRAYRSRLRQRELAQAS